eukprot:RCo005395
MTLEQHKENQRATVHQKGTCGNGGAQANREKFLSVEGHTTNSTLKAEHKLDMTEANRARLGGEQAQPHPPWKWRAAHFLHSMECVVTRGCSTRTFRITFSMTTFSGGFSRSCSDS